MNFVDILAENAKKQESLIDIVDAPVETTDFLSDSAQGFADSVGEDLGIPEGSIKTQKDWESLNKSEEAKLLSEEEDAVMSKAVAQAVQDGSKGELEKDIEGLSRIADKGIPYAASISANKNSFAVSDVNNPENLITPTEVMQKQQRAIGKSRVLQQAAEEARELAKKSSWLTFGKYFLGDFPGGEAYFAYDAVRVLGLEGEDIFQGDDIKNARTFLSKANANTYKELFMRFLGYLQDRDDISEEAFANILKSIRDKWDEKGVNIYKQAELLENALDFSPAASTFNTAMIIPTGINTAGFLSKAGVAASKGLYVGAIKNVGLAGVEATQIPFGGKLVSLSMKPVDRAVRHFAPKGDVAKTIEKAISTNDRALIKDYTERLLGAPKDTEYMVKGVREEGTLKYFIDPVVDTVDTPERSLANSTDAIAQKISNTVRERMQLIIEKETGFQKITQEYLEKLSKRVLDSVDMDNLVAAGRGRYGEKIVAITDLGDSLRSKNGNLVFAVKLVNDNDPVSAFQSIVKKDSKGNLVDVGRKAAEKLGNDLTELAKIYGEGLDVRYTTDLVKLSNENSYWRPTILIDTKKGLGTIHYEAFKEAGKLYQEKYRSTLSWLATVTSNPTHIRALDITRDLDSSLYKVSGATAIESFKALPKESQKYVQSLVDISTDYGAWYDPAKLLSAGSSEAEVQAYMNFKMMNDLDEFVRNRVMRAELVAKGGKKVYFNNQELEGVVRPVPEIHSAQTLAEKIEGKKVLIDSIEGTPKALTDKGKIKELYDKGYILIEPSISPDATISARSFYYLLNPQSTTINDLGAFVTTYVAGGRRYFRKGANYAKQLVMDTTDNGRRAIVGVRTLFTDMDSTGLSERIGVIEEARKLYIAGKTEECTKLIQSQGWQKAPFNDAQSFYEYFVERGLDFINLDNPLVVTQEGRILSSYTDILRSSQVDDLVGLEGMKDFVKNSRYQAISNEAKVQRMKRTGAELLTWDFEKAQTVDFEMQMRYLVEDMVQTDTMGSYTDYVADHFAKTFRDVMNPKIEGDKIIEQTPREMLIDGTVKEGLKGADAKLAKEAITAQKNYAMIRGVPSTADKAAANALINTIEWVFDKVGGVLPKSLEQAKHGVRVKWNEWIDESNPLLFLRTFTAHKVLGCFNTQQLLRQGAQDISIFLMDKNALSCAWDAAKIESIMIKSQGDIVKATKFAKEAFKGDKVLLNNALNIIDMGLFEHGTAGGFLERGASVKGTLSRLSFMPFNLGEMHPRILSGLTALKTKGLYGTRASYQDLTNASLYARSLFMNMDSSGLSRLQSSQIAATILQFQTPTFRWFETLFDPNLSRWQRFKLGVGTALLVGGEGIVGVGAYNTISNNLYRIFHDDRVEDLPTQKESNEIVELIRKGILNQTLSDYLGGVNVAAPLELNAMEVLDLVTGVADLEVKDVASVQSVLALVKGGKELYTGLKTLVKGTGTDEDLNAFLERFPRYLPSSISKPWMAFNIYRSGEILNTKGELTARTNSNLLIVLMALGFNSLTNKEIAKAYAERQYRTSVLKDFENELYEAAIRWSRYKSPESWDAFATVLNGANVYPEERVKVLNKVFKRLPDAFKAKIDILELQQYMNSGMSGSNLIR